MARNEGLRGMMKGNGVPASRRRVAFASRSRRPGANCLRIVPNSAVKFLTYEHASRLILERRRAGDADAELTARAYLFSPRRISRSLSDARCRSRCCVWRRARWRGWLR